MRLHALLIFLSNIFILGIIPVRGQETDIEGIFENLGAETTVSPELDVLERLAERPINLRRATSRELAVIPGFSSIVARRVLRLALFAPDSLGIEFIADSLRLSPEQYFLLKGCAYLGDAATAASAKTIVYRARSAHRFQDTKGVKNGVYLGSRADIYQRLLVNYETVLAGVIVNKEAGEASIADFASGYIEARSSGFRGIVGDYIVSSGIGCVLWRQFGLRKGVSAIAPISGYGGGISPSRSTLDFGFFRGGALEYAMPIGDSASVILTAFASKIMRSAAIDSVGNAVSIKTDGYFRTATDEARRNTLSELAVGAIAEIKSPNLTATVSALNLRYGFPIVSAASTAFSGREGVLFSAAGQWSPSDALQASGEISRDGQGYIGGNAALIISGDRITGVIGSRAFGARFRSPFGYSFGEFATPGNEYGLYAAAEWRGKNIQIVGYADIYGSFIPRFNMTNPTRGIDFFIENRNKLPSGAKLLFRARLEQKNDAFSTPEARADYMTERFSFRVECEQSVAKYLSVRLRGEGAYAGFSGIKTPENGAICFGEAKWRASGWLSLSGRLTLFSAQSFASALWSYEYALPGVMSSSALYGAGSRAFLLAAVTPQSNYILRVLYVATAKNGVSSLGSGNDQIDGALDSRLTFQIDAVW